MKYIIKINNNNILSELLNEMTSTKSNNISILKKNIYL